MSHLTQLQPPRALPISLADARLHARASTDDDELLTRCLRGAVAFVEGYTWKALVGQQLRETFDGFYGDGLISGSLPLSRNPVQAVTALQYIDAGGVLQTLSTDDYQVKRAPGAVVLPSYNTSWPSTRDELENVTLTYRAGYLEPVIAVDAAANTITLEGLPLVEQQALPLTATQGATVPGGLTDGVTYYAKNVSGLTCQLSLVPGGSALDLTSTGSGQLFVGTCPDDVLQAIRVLTTGAYEFRTPKHEFQLSDLPYGNAVLSLLGPYRPARF